jgi:4-amino-4-deoxy-L-arabinose transferase-like glycosyltransferase
LIAALARHFSLTDVGTARRLSLLIAALLLLPWLGSTGLTSPWEAQYAEVAREMTTTGDYVYPTYRGTGFFSKPILTMWLTAPGLSLTGGWQADGAHSPWMPWGVRLPIALLTLFFFATLFWAMERIWDHRVAFYSVVVGATTPFVLLTSKQAITDMPFVALSGAALMLLMGFLFGREDLESNCAVDAVGLLFIALLAALAADLLLGVTFPGWPGGGRIGAAVAVAALTYVTLQRRALIQLAEGEGSLLVCPTGPMPSWFLAGFLSLLGLQAFWFSINPQPDPVVLLGSVRIYSRFTVTVVMLVAGALLAWRVRGFSRREMPLIGFYILVGLATLAKGFGGILLPGAVALAYIVLAWDWAVIRRVRVVTGTLVALVVGAPWFLIMFAFPGRDEEHKTFYSRFVVHDHLRRIGGGIHGDQSKRGLGFDYYVRYLGYGLFPWVMTLPFAVSDAASEREASTPRRQATLFLLAWLGVAFLLFTLMATKFHHYALPVALPAIALVGLFVARLAADKSRMTVGMVAMVVMVGVAVASDLVRMPWEWMDLTTYHYINYKPDTYFPNPVGGQCDIATTYCWLLGVVPITLSMNWPVLIGALVVTCIGLTVIGTVFLRAQRGPAWLTPARGMIGAGVLSAVFIAHVYFPMLSQHWTHGHLVQTYFDQRDPSDPLIAYQMNWHGETFYARNLDFQVNDASRLRQLVERPGDAWVLVERSRFDGMKKSLGNRYKDQIVIADRSNVKWFLVQVMD